MGTRQRVRGRILAHFAAIAMSGGLMAGCSNVPGTLGESSDAQLTSASTAKPDSKVALGLAGATSSAVPSSAASPAPRGATGSGTTSAAADAIKAADALLATSTPGNSAYRIGPADVIEVVVLKVPDLSKQVQVGDNGLVNLALVGETMVAGKTAQEVERELTKVLGDKYLRNPSVTVYIREYNSQRVTVEGAVRTPGLYPIRGKSTLLQMLATCGGLTDLADSNVLVFRYVNGKRTAAKFEANDIRTGDTPDPPLLAGDVVVVNTSAGKEAFNNFVKIVPLAKAFSLF